MTYMKPKFWRVTESRISTIQSVKMRVHCCGELKKNVFEDKNYKKYSGNGKGGSDTNLDITKCDCCVGIKSEVKFLMNKKESDD